MKTEDAEFAAVMMAYIADGDPLERLKNLHSIVCKMKAELEKGISVFERPGQPERVREENESALLNRAQLAVSRANWEVGECATIWTKRFSRGRTDADFASLTGLTPDQIYQRRRVYTTFADVFHNYPNLRWSHFFAAIDWTDAHYCLKWADDVQAGVAEMKAWRRAQHGEDLDRICEQETVQGTLFE